MALNIVSHPSDTDSGLDTSFLTNQNAMTITGVVLGAGTLGGSALVGAAMAPGYALSGVIATGMALGGGYLKETTGSCFPFLGDKKDDTTVVEAAVAA